MLNDIVIKFLLVFFENNSIEKIEVWHGKKDFVNAYVKKDIYKTIPKARKKFLKVYKKIL